MEAVNMLVTSSQKAKDGSILIKKNGQWIPTTFAELNEENNHRLKELEGLKNEFKMLADNNQHFTHYAKSHFMVVFNSFKIKVILGELDLDDETLMTLDERVLNGSISVKEAIKLHPYLEDTFNKVFEDENDLITFPQV